MNEDPDEEPRSEVVPPNPARVYREYLLTCRRLGIPPVSPERAKVLLKEWAASRANGWQADRIAPSATDRTTAAASAA